MLGWVMCLRRAVPEKANSWLFFSTNYATNPQKGTILLKYGAQKAKVEKKSKVKKYFFFIGACGALAFFFPAPAAPFFNRVV